MLKNMLKKYLSLKSMLFTKERGQVLDFIEKQKRHFKAEPAFARLKKKYPGISRPTYYRNLKLLVKSGILGKSNLEDGQVLYEKIADRGHHDHFICLECGRIAEFKDAVLERRQKQICKMNNFLPQRHQLQIFGTCRECAR